MSPGSYRPPTTRLTPRETEILELLVSEAASNPDISARLGIRVETVKRHLSNIMNKTGYSTRLELAVMTLHKRYQK